METIQGPKKRVLITGPPLNGRDEYLEQVVKELKRRGKEVFLYRVFEYMKEVGEKYGFTNITRENILDLPEQDILKRLRIDALKDIDTDIESVSNGIHIISTPNIFFVRPHSGTPRRKIYGLTEEYVRIIKPDLIIIIIDNAFSVLRRFNSDDVWKRRLGTMSLEQVVQWRDESILNIERMVRYIYEWENRHIPYIIFSVNHPHNVLADLIEGIKPWIYLSYNMTGAKSFEKINRFYTKLLKYFVVFDPGTIEEWKLVKKYDEALENNEKVVKISVNDHTMEFSIEDIERAIDIIRAHIVSRDYNLVENSNALCVYHHMNTPSYGVMAEVMRASSLGKPIYVLYPFKHRLSPFFEHYVGSSYSENIISKRSFLGDRIHEYDEEELENLLIKKMLNDVCSNKWPTWKINEEYYNAYCKNLER